MNASRHSTCGRSRHLSSVGGITVMLPHTVQKQEKGKALASFRVCHKMVTKERSRQGSINLTGIYQVLDPP
jgi:hypothetical protein